MIRKEEINSPHSCLNKAGDAEMVFTMLARDRCAPMAIRFWCIMRMLLGLNRRSDRKIREAWACAARMDRQRAEGIDRSRAPVLATVGHLRSVEVGPGDTLVVSIEQTITDETAARIKNQLQAEFPGRRCLVLSEGMGLGVVRVREGGCAASGR